MLLQVQKNKKLKSKKVNYPEAIVHLHVHVVFLKKYRKLYLIAHQITRGDL